MIDSDNVLLLRPARPASGIFAREANGNQRERRRMDAGLVEATICHLKDGIAEKT